MNLSAIIFWPAFVKSSTAIYKTMTSTSDEFDKTSDELDKLLDLAEILQARVRRLRDLRLVTPVVGSLPLIVLSVIYINLIELSRIAEVISISFALVSFLGSALLFRNIMRNYLSERKALDRCTAILGEFFYSRSFGSILERTRFEIRLARLDLGFSHLRKTARRSE